MDGRAGVMMDDDDDDEEEANDDDEKDDDDDDAEVGDIVCVGEDGVMGDDTEVELDPFCNTDKIDWPEVEDAAVGEGGTGSNDVT